MTTGKQQLAAFTQTQKVAILQSGTPEAIFDAGFSGAYTRTLARLTKAGEQERELTCQPLRAMAGQP